ncbi:MAG: glycoside hydrolase family 3 C-terminal domain-containing protein [Anaerolineales bacterium]
MSQKQKMSTASRRTFLKTAAAAAGGLVLSGCGGNKPTPLPTRPPSQITPTVSPAVPIYPDPERPLAERVSDLVDRMTVEELASQMDTDSLPIERLGVPAYNWWNEAAHGVARAGVATVFPQVIGLAATWNTELIHRIAEAISDEGRAKYHDALRKDIHAMYFGLTFFAPNINIVRDPRWGRGQETFGEDPHLTARLAVEFVRGMQGDDPKYLKTAATPKHFAAHSGPEKDRFSFNAVVSTRDLRMTYLPAFRACVTEGKAASIMGAYNRLNGQACCADPFLLKEILRGEWGFDGYVVADCGAVGFIYHAHRLVNSQAEGAALSVTGGVDLECGCTLGLPCHFRKLPQAVEDNIVSLEDLKQSAKRLFTARFRLGMFDPPESVPYAQTPIDVVDCPEHRELALEAARQSLVLLKNEGGMLPLDRDVIRSIAVIGPRAASTEVLHGNYNGTPAEPVSLLDGIKAAVKPGTKVNYAVGCDLIINTSGKLEPALQAAGDSQVAVLVLGLSQYLESEAMQEGGNIVGDRATLDLPEVQETLLKAVVDTGTPVVLVLLNGSCVSINWADKHVPAILEAWYPGQAGGTAVAEALFGETNPGGRLPVTFYRSTSDLPDFEDYSMENRTYRYFKGSPLFPFGYGLSYTTFAYRNLRISPQEIAAGDPVTVTVEVENTGGREGDEVVQLYLRDEEASLPVPQLQLQGFARVRLLPGRRKALRFTITPEQMAFADEDGNWILEPGSFRVWVGGGQPGWQPGHRSVPGLEGSFAVRP